MKSFIQKQDAKVSRHALILFRARHVFFSFFDVPYYNGKNKWKLTWAQSVNISMHLHVSIDLTEIVGKPVIWVACEQHMR